MLIQLIAAVILLLALMMAWIEVQRMARHVAAQHPEAGPLRLVGGGCGGQGHGDAAAPAPTPKKRPAAKKPEGCEACSNTACKPGALAEPSRGELHPLPH
jgi:hypothetical protein